MCCEKSEPMYKRKVYDQRLAIFFFLAKGYIVNIWGFEGYVVTVISTANCQPQTIYKQMGIAVFQ